LEITVTVTLGYVSATAMAARNPAPPPPTMRTSHEKVSMKFFDFRHYVVQRAGVKT
jgi:hypothetical protein